MPYDNADTEEAFWQELFGTYVQFDALLASGRLPMTKLRTTPVPPSSPLYDLGKHVGAALAGSEANRRHIEAWREGGGKAAFKRRLVDAGLALKPPMTVEDIVAAYNPT